MSKSIYNISKAVLTLLLFSLAFDGLASDRIVKYKNESVACRFEEPSNLGYENCLSECRIARQQCVRSKGDGTCDTGDGLSKYLNCIELMCDDPLTDCVCQCGRSFGNNIRWK